ncbi:NAD(P)-dependent oxidoreductase [Pelagibacteraceae bacterium]|nr:NAD(P)-dependent oxidoreductase [Pelagibacteraceae bacterium]
MKIGFIGLGNVGFKLANSILESGFDLLINDLDKNTGKSLIEKGAKWIETPKALAQESNISITCLPSPSVVSNVLEGSKGLIEGMGPGKLWIEMSTTDDKEMQRLASLVIDKNAFAIEAPVSGGCHRAATGNIAILVGGTREAFDLAMPALSAIGYQILHIGPIGSASVLKVATNYLASTHLAAVGEALMVCKKAGLDLPKVYEGIKISSGNSFVHETESQVIMNGSYNINFTMDLVCKDVGLFEKLAQDMQVPTEVSPLITKIFKEGREKYGDRAWSSMIVKRLEDACGENLRASGYPDELIDDTPRRKGYEVIPNNIK